MSASTSAPRRRSRRSCTPSRPGCRPRSRASRRLCRSWPRELRGRRRGTGHRTSSGAGSRGSGWRLRTGNLGILPIVLGIVLIVLFFTIKTPVFFTANNFHNIIIQTAGTCMLAFGVVFVLLLGEIDLSIGYLSGLGAVAVAEFQLPDSSHQYPGLVAIVLAV